MTNETGSPARALSLLYHSARVSSILRDAVDTVERHVHLLEAENERLRLWKREAIDVLERWENVHTALGEPARLGESKADASTNEALRLTAENERLREAMADAIECLGDWGAYAPDYFKEKWDLDGDLAHLRGALSGSVEQHA